MKCVICGKEIEESSYANKILCSSACFQEDFWNEHLDEDAIIVNGVCYHDGGRKPDGYSGFFGHKFTIKMLADGRVINTNKLWYNGEVPEERKVPDNAVFVLGI